MRASFCLEPVMRSSPFSSMVCGEVQTLLGDRDVDVCPIQRRRTLHQLPAARQQNARGSVVRVLREHRDGSGEVAGGVRLEPPLGTPRIAPGYACNGRALADDVWSYLSRSRPCRSFRAFATFASPPPKALPGWRPPWRCSRLAWSSVGTGWGKLHDLDKVTEFFTELGIPAPGFNAVLASTAEFVCGSLLLAGLFSRLASLPLIVTMIVAIVTAKRDALHGIADLLGFEEWTYIVLAVWIAVAGPGPSRWTRPGYFLCRDARRSRGVGGTAVPFAHIAYCGERASPTATGGCEESAAAQARDVPGLAALDDRAPDEMHGFVADDGDAGAAGHCASVAPGGLAPSVAMAVTTSRPKADTLRDADPRDGGAKPKVGRRAASR